MLCALFLFPVAAAVGCAHAQPDVSQQKVDTMQKRVEEIERMNGRLTVRVEELEKQILLLEDRLEANRLALQRRGYVRGDAVAGAEARPLQPAPESHYRDDYGDYSARPTVTQPSVRRNVSRIPLSAEQSGHYDEGFGAGSQEMVVVAEPDREDYDVDEPEIVITDEDFRAIFGEPPPTPAPAARATGGSGGAGAASTAGRTAQPNVTSERLPTSSELAGRSPEAAPVRPEQPRNQRDQMALYQDSLAEYRSGNYAQALVGFETFLAAGPRSDYIDNALYWIGECHYGMGDYPVAVVYFQRILDELPQATKVPDAMLKMSLAFDRMGRSPDAVALLERLTEQYPTSNPGQLGMKRLANHPSRQ
jgi:tol-pal system protein YbgF